MREKVVKKKYYKIEFTLVSPCMTGSGEDRYTDADIIKDGEGIPYIPGSALAGIDRELMVAKGKDIIEDYFGMVPEAEEAANGERAKESRLIIYDARIREKDLSMYHISRRDCVALDEWKTAKPGSKFDMEVLEPGCEFVTYLEQSLYQNDREVAKEIAYAWLNNRVRIGAKTTRGYGEIGNVRIKSKEFCMEKRTDVEKWLDFDLYQESAWDDAVVLTEKKTEKGEEKSSSILRLELELIGGISIRRYSTKCGTENLPDYEQLTLCSFGEKEGEQEPLIPVIPGTTWAGVFRDRVRRLVPDCEEDYFGYVKEDAKEKKKSAIRFSESRITGAKPKILSHNAIDRFSGGVVENALYTEMTYYGGTANLKITFDTNISEALQKAFAAAVEDLHQGFMAIGGLTAIGRGIFKVRKINGKSVGEENSIYHMVLGELKTVGEGAKL